MASLKLQASTTIGECIDDKPTLDRLHAFLKDHFCENYLDFLIELRTFSTLPPTNRGTSAESVWSRFISTESEERVHLPEEYIEKLREVLFVSSEDGPPKAKDDLSDDVFVEVERYTTLHLENDAFARFKLSVLYPPAPCALDLVDESSSSPPASPPINRRCCSLSPLL
eukprot:CAMPEP_0177649140 /NCGR_PEP_ID=MMETSP0447-20121125/11209_1 /TAXON_ID=0 /ORGANISM="Stygamoeba regulata, Strain BSH-02190019" /LENGTH=168 /DNA_ID=CAMNT_0019151841 /DNA_START=475 /DNA_END=981 /DNA_ORIENTATION=-